MRSRADFRVADERSARVPYRREDDVRPEQRAVLPDAPFFILESPVSRGHLELVAREPRGDHVCRIKRFERAAEDLVSCVPYNLQCPFVPAGDTAFGIEHEDRIIVDLLYQQPELVLASAPRCIGFFPIRHIDAASDVSAEVSMVVRIRNAAIENPAIHAIVAAHPVFHFEWHPPIEA